MQKKHLVISASAVLLIIISVVIPNITFTAESAVEIQYPIAELGNCQNEINCKAYCEKSQNIDICLDFAKENNLMSQKEIKIAKLLAEDIDGPGGCGNQDACESYCNEISHINECVAFAEEYDLMSSEELSEAKQVQAAIAKGVKPPACQNKKSCDLYCEDLNHMDECVAFAEAAGFLQGEELEDAKKMLAAIKRGVKPLPCMGREECEVFCSNPKNMESCITFATEAGFMSEEEKADAQKMLQAIQKGINPPNCRSKEECDIYCGQEEHFQECLAFAEAAGFMSAEEAEMARKTGGMGPGGCKSQEECEAFCSNPDNQETCFNFAQEIGLPIQEGDLQAIEAGKQRLQEALGQAPAAVLECLSAQIGTDMVEGIKNGTVMPSVEIGDQLHACFEQLNQLPGTMESSGGGLIIPSGYTGPGGCTTMEECTNYCTQNPQECQGFMPPQQPSTSPEEQQFMTPPPSDYQQPPIYENPPPSSFFSKSMLATLFPALMILLNR